MNEKYELVMRSILIGVGATLLMDLWAALLRQLGIPSLNFAFLGRWIGHLPQGRWIHESIARAAPVRGELVLGWLAHYSIGIAFAALLLSIFGLEWARSPSLLPPLFIGIVTVLAPLLILQPALGAGIASSKTPWVTLLTRHAAGTRSDLQGPRSTAILGLAISALAGVAYALSSVVPNPFASLVVLLIGRGLLGSSLETHLGFAGMSLMATVAPLLGIAAALFAQPVKPIAGARIHQHRILCAARKVREEHADGGR